MEERRGHHLLGEVSPSAARTSRLVHRGRSELDAEADAQQTPHEILGNIAFVSSRPIK